MDDSHAKAGDTAKAPSPPRDWTVTAYEIRLRWLGLVSLSAELVQSTRGPAGDLHVNAELASRKEMEFTSEVTWGIEARSERAETARVGGVFRLRFAHKPGLPDEGARYYAGLNSVILAYPYIREAVSRLTADMLGETLVIDPLDVPSFVRDQLKPPADAGRAGAEGARPETGTDAPGVQ